jgi:hypothetical protein
MGLLKMRFNHVSRSLEFNSRVHVNPITLSVSGTGFKIAISLPCLRILVVSRPILIVAGFLTLLSACTSPTSDNHIEQPDVIAHFTVKPVWGTASAMYYFDASESQPATGNLNYRWDWESDGTWDTELLSFQEKRHRFSNGDSITVTLEVRYQNTPDLTSRTILFETNIASTVRKIPIYIQLPTGLTWDGANLWLTDWHEPQGTHRIFKIDPTSGDTLYSIPAPSSWPGAIAWDGACLWVTDYISDSRLFKLDPSNGQIMASFPVEYSAYCGGLAWDGEYFYMGSYKHEHLGDGMIHKYTYTGNPVTSFPAPGGSDQPTGLTFDGEHLWASIAYSDVLYAIDRNNGNVTGTVGVPGLLQSESVSVRTGDITFDGTCLWYIWRAGDKQLACIQP